MNVSEAAAEAATGASLATQLPVWLAFGTIVVAGLLGNLFVVSVIVPDERMMRCSINRLLLNLAAFDFANVLFCVPDVLQAGNDAGWVLPAFLCPLIRFFQIYFLYESILIQLAIGIERYLAICHPLHVKRLSSKSVAGTLLAVWLVGAVTASPYFIYSRSRTLLDGSDVCHTWDLTFEKAFKTAECVVYYILPLIVLSTLYMRTGCALWGRNRMLHHADSAQARAILVLRRSVVKMLVLCVVVYFVCYSPIQVLFLSGAFFGQTIDVPMWLRLLFNALTLANSAANPIIYIVCCKQFRVKLYLFMRRVSVNISEIPGFQFRTNTATTAATIAAQTAIALGFHSQLPPNFVARPASRLSIGSCPRTSPRSRVCEHEQEESLTAL